MKNWKKVSTFLLALSMSVSLALGISACGGSEPSTSTPDTSSSSQDSSISSSNDETSNDETSSDDASSETSSGSADDNSSSSEPTDDSSSTPDDTSSSSEPADDSSSEEEWDGESPLVKKKKGYTEEGEYGKVFTYPDIMAAENFEMYSWTEYELVQETSCLTAGIKQVRWVDDETVVHQEYIAPRGHDYTYRNGYCKCGAGPVYPKAPSSIKYIEVQSSKSGIMGKGAEYDRYELTEGYFEITCKLDPIWLSFSIDEPGQYALYTTTTVDASVELNRYDASAQYIPVGADGKTYINFPATKTAKGLYSTVSCPTVMWSEHWRATYSIDGDRGTTVKLRFVKIDEEAWTPKTVRVQHLAQQINNKHAPAGPENTSPVVVPYETDYFYEESSGYYRMGTPENPGDIIYVAITSVPPRMLLDKAFTQIQYEAASNLYLSYSTTIDGDYLVRDYIPFISNDTSYGGVPGNCYQDFVNVDGMYPVNAELFEFLNLYVKKNCPMEIPEEIKQDADEFNKRAWLAACYYYKNLKPGSSDLPYEIDGVGEQQVATTENEWTYYSISYTNNDSQSTITYCTLSCNDANAAISINEGEPVFAPFSIIIETSAAQPFTFSVISQTFEAETFTFNIAPGYAGSQDDPEVVNITKGEQVVEMNSIEHLMTNGTVNNQKYYTFTVAEDGTLNLSSNVEKVLVSISYTDADGMGVTVMLSNWEELEVKAGDVLEIVVGPANDPIDFNMTITLS